MFTKKFYKKFVKSLMELNSMFRKELKSFIGKANYQLMRLSYLFMNDYCFVKILQASF